MARALVSDPRILLLDEPLNNLDANLREEMRFEIKALQQKLGITILYVTHDQEIALGISDRLAVMAALDCVSLVTWFDEDTPIERILDCKPDVLVKGGDWPLEKIVGNAEVAGWGGKTVSIPFIHQKSTTALLDKIRTL